MSEADDDIRTVRGPKWRWWQWLFCFFRRGNHGPQKPDGSGFVWACPRCGVVCISYKVMEGGVDV